MISSIEGLVVGRGDDWVEIAIGGVGVRASIPTSATGEIGPVGAPLRLFTHLQVRDESIILYGFRSPEERVAFLALLGVSGIGPRLALVILSVLNPVRLIEAIEQGDAASLSKAPGVGKRSASRIIVELKGKLDELDLAGLAGSSPSAVADNELTAALQALGYTGAEIRRAVATVSGADPESRPPIGERIRLALAAMTDN